MVPRTEMACIHQDAPLSAALDEVRRHGYWRYPVYREDYDDIVGVVTVKDLLYHVGQQDGGGVVSAIMRPARFVPESKQALELLKEMQAADEQMAVVIDEYGGVSGPVTMEDLLEEIIGAIAEEPRVPAQEQAEGGAQKDDERCLAELRRLLPEMAELTRVTSLSGLSVANLRRVARALPSIGLSRAEIRDGTKEQILNAIREAIAPKDGD